MILLIQVLAWRKIIMTTLCQFRLDEKEKQEAFAIFDELGISASEALRLFIRQVTLTRSIPFEVKLPNAETQQVLNEIKQGKKLHSFENTEELTEWLNAD